MPRRDIIYRTLQLIASVTDDRRRLKQLEEETGIPDRQWKHVWALKQRPTAHMLEALARRWPEYAFWLTTGITDLPNGHIKPGPKSRDDGSEVSACLEAELAASREFFDLELLFQELAPHEDDHDPDTSRNEALSALGGFVEQVAGEAPSEQDEQLWLRYLTLLNRQEESKELDRAIARIAREKRVHSLATSFRIDLQDPTARLEVAKKMMQASAERNAHSRVREAAKADLKKRKR